MLLIGDLRLPWGVFLDDLVSVKPEFDDYNDQVRVRTQA